MITTVNGALFRELLDCGIRNLALHGKEINELNVFPVPDGDTGTNMVLTLRNGYAAVGEARSLPDVAHAFASAVILGARGNSGVIVSRFFKGFCETLGQREEADCHLFLRALTLGTEEAYRAVSHPTEGTMLTVLREAGERAERFLTEREEGDEPDLLRLLEVYLKEARESLARTPELLPVLKTAGVVDSGGAGVVCVFEGMEKCLRGEPISVALPPLTAEAAVDYSRFNRHSRFEFGYCTELLLQITEGREPLDPVAFKAYLESAGDSVATTFDGDKVKIHVHTDTPERVMAEAHRYGEFLSLKIENMSVQHTEVSRRNEEDGKADLDDASKTTLILPDVRREAGRVSVVVCAPDRKTAALFHSMGADAALICPAGAAPTTKDFADAVKAVGARSAVIFANHKNYALSASKAAELLGEDFTVCVVRSDSVAACYAAMALLDFEADAEQIALDAEATIDNLYTVTCLQAVKEATLDGVEIRRGDYLAMDGEGVVAADEELWELVKQVMNGYVKEYGEPDTVTVFTGKGTPEGLADMIEKRVGRKYRFTETDLVETDSETYDLILSFE